MLNCIIQQQLKFRGMRTQIKTEKSEKERRNQTFALYVFKLVSADNTDKLTLPLQCRSELILDNLYLHVRFGHMKVKCNDSIQFTQAFEHRNNFTFKRF